VRCSFCKNRAVVYLPASRISLCKRHFVYRFERKVKRTIRDYHLVDGAERIGVALSGGKDSINVLYILNQILKPMRKELIAITIDEGIKGYRDKLIENSAKICKKLGIKHEVRSFKEELGITMDEIAKIPREEREITCTYCGVFRRWLINKVARELGIERIAVGHNLDDVVQSFLMNLYRNELFRLARFGPRSGIVEHEGFVERIRPLYRVLEKESALYAVLNGLKTEFEECPYVRESFRASVRDQLNQMEDKYPGTKFKLFNSFIAVNELLKKKYEGKGLERIVECSICGEPTSGETCKKCELLEKVFKLRKRK